MVIIDRGTATTVPSHALPYMPVSVPSSPRSDIFSRVERLEFGASSGEALQEYRQLARHTDPHIRAGALLRLGRILRKSKRLEEALEAYRTLSSSGDVWIEGLPAELAGLEGQRATLITMGDGRRAHAVASALANNLDRGRWAITRGVAEFYRDGASSDTPPDAWRLAYALSETMGEANGRLSARGQRIIRTDRGSVLVMWRTSGERAALLAAFAPAFLAGDALNSAGWQIADADGQTIAGGAAPSHTAARILGHSDYPWTVRTWNPSAQSLDGNRNGQAILLTMMGAMLVFVWGASYFIARAMRRESDVARLQSDFVAAVSHEFRSPLTTVRQMAEMLESGRLHSEERRRTYYGIIASEAARLQRLVETLLNFGRMEAGAAQYQFADIDAGALVRTVVHEMAPQAQHAGTHIDLSGPDTAVRVRADAAALALALRNLIDNAIKYSPDRSAVQVQWKSENSRAAICVADRGVGIPGAEQHAIFRKFVRGRSAIDANIRGTGVGLSMVQEIVRAHGGEIRLDSQVGRGSAFTLFVPLANADAADLKVGTT
jgi:signal transduction histidine kinase